MAYEKAQKNPKTFTTFIFFNYTLETILCTSKNILWNTFSILNDVNSIPARISWNHRQPLRMIPIQQRRFFVKCHHSVRPLSCFYFVISLALCEKKRIKRNFILSTSPVYFHHFDQWNAIKARDEKRVEKLVHSIQIFKRDRRLHVEFHYWNWQHNWNLAFQCSKIIWVMNKSSHFVIKKQL